MPGDSRRRLHPIVEAHSEIRALRSEEVAQAKRAAKIRETLRKAEEEHQDRLRQWFADLDAGTAGPRPEYHAPADPSRIERDRLALRDRERRVLADLDDDVETALRVRAAEVLDRVALVISDVIDPATADLAEIVSTMRRLYAARGYATGTSTALPRIVDRSSVVDHASNGVPIIPAVVVPVDVAPAWTADPAEDTPVSRYR